MHAKLINAGGWRRPNQQADRRGMTPCVRADVTCMAMRGVDLSCARNKLDKIHFQRYGLNLGLMGSSCTDGPCLCLNMSLHYKEGTLLPLQSST
jgi:hypothetical protein